MKKSNKTTQKLVLKKMSLICLDQEGMTQVQAGDDLAVAPGETYLCAPPFNAPPYFYPNTRNECVNG